MECVCATECIETNMASFKELKLEWAALSQDCTDWTPEDLQLAAELGKTLLERNKELETSLRQHQNIIEDQTQEIEHLSKQTAALREVNDSRLRIYEQLEVSILDLERTNRIQALDSAADKKTIKTLCINIDTLEARCEELQKQAEELQKQVEKKPDYGGNTNGNNNVPKRDGFTKAPTLDEEVDKMRGEMQDLRAQRLRDQRRASKLEEQVQALLRENQVMEEQLSVFQLREEEMKIQQEETMSNLEEIRTGRLCGRCSQKMDPRGSLFERLQFPDSSLIGGTEDGDDYDEEVSLIDSYISDTHHAPALLQLQEHANENKYRDLVEKYEALVELQSHPASGQHHRKPNAGPVNSSPAVSALPPVSVPASTKCLSLQEELQMSGDFNGFRNEDDESDNEVNTTSRRPGNNSESESTKKSLSRNKTFSTTPTDFSEVETSSSGYSDETSNKTTQTESRMPSSFLCTIMDGEDCRFSIYDDASPVDSRFRKTPEYRSLFREIFSVLKRAAEAKDEGEKLPLLDDTTAGHEPPRVPPVTPAKEDLPLLKMLAQDGTQTSVISEEASEICSEVCSEIVADAEVQMVTECLQEESSCGMADAKDAVTGEAPPEIVQNPTSSGSESASECNPEKKTSESDSSPVQSDPEPKPASPAPKKDIMEYLAAGVGPSRKKNHSRKNSPHMSPRKGVERIDPAKVPLHFSTRVTYTKGGSSRRRRERHSDSPSRGSGSPSRQSESPSRQESQMHSSRGHSSPVTAQCRKEVDECPSQASTSNHQSTLQSKGAWGYKPYTSPASQEIAKLKKLDSTYAEVLRRQAQRRGPEQMLSRGTQVNCRMSHLPK